jgi:hypothetical protein
MFVGPTNGFQAAPTRLYIKLVQTQQGRAAGRLWRDLAASCIHFNIG